MHPTATLLILRGFKPYVIGHMGARAWRIMRGQREGEPMVGFVPTGPVWQTTHMPSISFYTPITWEQIGDDIDLLEDEMLAWLMN